MELFGEIINRLDSIIWGPLTLILFVGTGVYLTIKLRFLPWINLPHALKSVLSRDAHKSEGAGDVSAFGSLMTALAATIGTGNIVGVATAMVAGGPGALVWMWIAALFGLSTKYAECLLATKYREVNEKGEISGGPMYAMKNGFKNKKIGSIMGTLFALFTAIATFGIGNMSQANSISGSFHNMFGISPIFVGIGLTIIVFPIVVGGIKSISGVSTIVVPLMAVLYVVAGLVCIILNYKNIPSGLEQIFVMAVNPHAIGGGVIGSITVSVMNAVRFGVARGVFSNEAGLGSAAIPAAASTIEDPAKQGYISMTGTFFDTIVVCTITGLTIASSGLIGTVGADGKPLEGVALTAAAFGSVLGPIGKYLVSIGIILFAFSTILGWEYYGEKAFEYLVGSTKWSMFYRAFFAIVTFFGATQSLDLVWGISDIMNALMAFPNLISLIVLSNVIKSETDRYQKIIKK
ncbi:MAG: sodium:alanine symporter family protein [Lachnospiraceae bacterium]|nr:sodium:alanine symporter family protein [Lachnospiraceae bacterium]